MKTKEDDLDNSFLNQSNDRTIHLPLMNKKMNTVQKYVNSFKFNVGNTSDLSRQKRNESILSNHAEKLVYGGKYTPDPHADRVNDKKCYVKYSSILQHKTEEKLQQLQKMQVQYEHLKNNLNSVRDVYTSKYTLPLYKRQPRKSESQLSRGEISQDQIDKQLRKQILVEGGQKQFADLYMMRKDRSQMKDLIQKSRKFTLKQQISQERQKQRQKFLIQKKFKQAQQRKNKMLKNKGLHWNVYYQMLALSKTQKERLKNSNSAFISTYGVN